MASPMKKAAQAAFRLPEDLRDRVDRLAERLGDDVGVRITRSAVLCMLIERGLDLAEKKMLDRAEKKID